MQREVDAVFAYASDPSLRPDWQEAVERIELIDGPPMRVGARVRETRRVQGRSRVFVWQVTEFEPNRRWGFRGTEGPVRAVAAMAFEPADGGTATVVRFTIDFEGRGIGRIFAPMARRGAQNEIPRDLATLKRIVESTNA